MAILYDFDMRLTGVLSPSKSMAARSHGCVLIMLSEGGAPDAQIEAISDLAGHSMF